MWFQVVVTLLGIFVAFMLRKRKEHFRYFEKLNIPGPTPNIICGNMWDVYKKGHFFATKDWHEKYGPVIGYFFGQEPVLLIADVELLKKIQIKDFTEFADRPDFMTGRGTGFHESALTVLKGQRWKEVRSTLTPSFTLSKLKHLNSEVSIVVDEFMTNMEKEEKSGNDKVDLYQYYQALTMDTISRTALGVNYNIQQDAHNHNLVRQAKITFGRPFNFLSLLMMSFKSMARISMIIYTLMLRRENKGVDPIVALQTECKKVVKFRKENTDNKRADLLQMLIDAQVVSDDVQNLTAGDEAETAEAKCPMARITSASKKLTEDEIVDNAFLVLLAGYETTSSGLAFISRLLLRFPEVQEKLREELLEATDGGKVFDFSRLQSCHYMEAVIQESLRMYPPIYAFTIRESTEEKVYDDITIPKGQAIFASTREIHYRPDYFPDPETFKPERFLPENKASLVANAWQPFGAGPRNCIGMRFAQMEMKITLAKLLTKYRISSDNEPKHDAKVAVEVLPVMIRIKDPLLCKLDRL